MCIPPWPSPSSRCFPPCPLQSQPPSCPTIGWQPTTRMNHKNLGAEGTIVTSWRKLWSPRDHCNLCKGTKKLQLRIIGCSGFCMYLSNSWFPCCFQTTLVDCSMFSSPLCQNMWLRFMDFESWIMFTDFTRNLLSPGWWISFLHASLQIIRWQRLQIL